MVRTLAAIQKKKKETGLSDTLHIRNKKISFTVPAPNQCQANRSAAVHEHRLARLTWGQEEPRIVDIVVTILHNAAGPGVVPPNVARVLGCFMQFYYICIAYYIHVWSLHTNVSV